MRNQKKTAYISPNAYDETKNFIRQSGYNIVKVNHPDQVSKPVSTHPDIFICKMEFSTSNNNSKIFFGDIKKLGNKYPDEAIYNACATGKYFVHNLKISDSDILDWAEQNGLEFVDVPQGYTRCNLLPVGPSNFITSDMGIFKALNNVGADVLLISNKNVALAGYEYGFLAGCAGIISSDLDLESLNSGKTCIDFGFLVHSDHGVSEIKSEKHTVLFNGDLSAHPDFKKISDFINSCGLSVAWVQNKELSDIGSILCTD
ncbi:hypothetical protein HMPREF1635_04455 [Clostridiales bacterium S5-A14a]|nr:hypothetical protein HMPREF1635_04455 [Clostridiales bacterium S5-A14a]